MRTAGASYIEIAAALGYANQGGAFKVVQAALKATYQEPADEVRRLELERLDRLTESIWDDACAGDFSAIDRVLKLMDRRASLLGLDRVNVNLHQTTDGPHTLHEHDPRHLGAGVVAPVEEPQGGDAPA